MLGVTHTTIQRDIEDGTNVPKQEAKPPKTKDKNKEDGTNVPEPPLVGILILVQMHQTKNLTYWKVR